MNIRKKVIAAAVVAAMTISVFCGNTLAVSAAEYWPDNLSVQSPAAIVMELETGTILYEKNIHQTYYPASITKIMTALVALENSRLDEVVTFSADAVYKNEGGTSHIARELGEQMTMEQCLYGMMLESANECAYAIGEHVGGSVDAFVGMMNDKAKELGCEDSHFNNTNGLPDTDHYVSAYDMAVISRAAYQNPVFAKIVGTKSYKIPPTNKHATETPLNNHHSMLHFYKTSKYLYEGCLGGKTGYTDAAGYTLVTYAQRDGMTLVAVVLNTVTPAQWTDTALLLDYCFNNFGVSCVADQAQLFTAEQGKVLGSFSDDMDLIEVDRSGVIVLPKTARFSEASATVTPVKDGKESAVVGRVEYTYAGHAVGGANLMYHQTKSQGFPFHNLSQEEGGSGIRSVHIDFVTIFLTLLALAAAVFLILFLYAALQRVLVRRRRKRNLQRRKKQTGYRTINRGRSRRRR